MGHENEGLPAGRPAPEPGPGLEAGPGDAPTRRAETTMLLKIALPLTAAYLAEYAMFVITKIVVGRLGYHELAAVGLAGELTFGVLVIMMGLLSIVGVLVAQAEGAGRKRDAGQAVRQGLIVATAMGVPATVLVWNLAPLLALSGQDPRVVELAAPYLHGLAGFVLPVLWFSVLRNFVAALARTGAIMVITVAAVALKYILTLGGSEPAVPGCRHRCPCETKRPGSVMRITALQPTKHLPRCLLTATYPGSVPGGTKW